MKSYMLVRVALDVGEEVWFGEKLGLPEFSKSGRGLPEGRGIYEASVSILKPSRGKLIWRLLGRRKVKRDFQEEQPDEGNGQVFRKEQPERAVLLEEREERIQRVEKAIKELAAEVLEYAGADSKCFCVYEGSVRKILLENRDLVLPVLWQNYFDQEEFSDYSSRFWVERLMPEAVLPHFVILGSAACIPEIIEEYACQMKSLYWILTEAACTAELQEFVEDFYLESGLAISMRTISEPREFRRLQPVCVLPSNILDFSGSGCMVDLSGVAEGSIWLDMQSAEEKRRRILGHNGQIAYISMREKWKYAQRRCNAPVLS